jgi:hypothetical protein
MDKQMNSHWYNTKAGVTRQSETLEGLYELFKQRHQAYYERKEDLHEFIIRGLWRLDNCGNVGKAHEQIKGDLIPGVKYPDIPAVLTPAEFNKFLEDKGEPDKHVSWVMNNDLPPAGHICPHCEKEWTIEDSFNVKVSNESIDVSANELHFVGKQIWEVKRHFNVHRRDAVYQLHKDSMVCNRRFIDLRPTPGMKERPLNKSGCVGERDGLGDWYVIQKDDIFPFIVTRHFHTKCYKEHIGDEEEMKFTECFTKGYLNVEAIERIPNEYCGCDSCGPWFKFKTPLGVFKLGWRKRVINLDWSATGKDYEHLFKTENVTVDKNSVHCWGYEKLTDYLRKIYFQSISPYNADFATFVSKTQGAMSNRED